MSEYPAVTTIFGELAKQLEKLANTCSATDRVRQLKAAKALTIALKESLQAVIEQAS